MALCLYGVSFLGIGLPLLTESFQGEEGPCSSKGSGEDFILPGTLLSPDLSEEVWLNAFPSYGSLTGYKQSEFFIIGIGRALKLTGRQGSWQKAAKAANLPGS